MRLNYSFFATSLFLTLLFLFTNRTEAQFLEDALRMVDNPTVINARSIGMGNAFVGVADDYSAIYWNPAGMALIRRPEFSFGLTNISTSNDATYLGAVKTGSNSNILLNNIGFVLPFPVMRGSMVFAVGYNRINDFTGEMAFSAFNSQNSIIPTLYREDERDDLAWNLGLQDTLGTTPLQRDLTQEGKIVESGGLNQWAFAGSVEVMRNLSLGLSFGIMTGTYRWDRKYSEIDTRNIYQDIIAGVDYDRTDFREFRLDESLMQDLSGWNATFGFMYNFDYRGRLGFTIKTPTFLGIQENFSADARSYFADAQEHWDGYPLLNYGDKHYDIRTPWIFSIGGSVNPVEFITVAASVDAIDYTQMEFDGAEFREDELRFIDLNDQIREDMRSTLNYHVGAEATIPETGLQVRGGYQYRQSPYKADEGMSEYDTKTFSFGLGYLFESTFLVSATYANTSYSTFQNVYSSISPDYPVRTDEKRTNSTVLLTIAYRF